MVWRGGLNKGLTLAVARSSNCVSASLLTQGLLREALETMGWERAMVQHYSDASGTIRLTQRTSEGQDIGGQVQRALQERLPGQTIDIRRMEAVGAQVSTELRYQAAFALLYAMLGMTIYISGRFEAKWLVAGGYAGPDCGTP